MVDGLKSALKVREVPAFLVLVALIIVFGAVQSSFLSSANWADVGRVYLAEIAFLTIAQAIVLLTGGIDLSIAAILALTSVIVGLLFVDLSVNIWLAALIGLVVATAAGLFNGVLISYIGVTPIVATLGTLTLFRGLALGLTGGRNVGGFPEAFQSMGQGTFLGLPTQIWILAVVLGVCIVVLGRSVHGRWIYSLGGNPEASRLAGIPIRRLTILAYAAAGFMSGIGGVVAAARFNTSRADFASGGEFIAVTAAIIGGVSIAGGRGTVYGAMIGACIIAVLRNGLTLGGYSGFMQIILIGVILIAGVLIDRLIVSRRRRRAVSEQLQAMEDTTSGSG